ncbi:hypothetical protein GUJ93_ZPchr0015g6616 [Zizania palustris]|uniref:Uncharacterized protein n=1 Tax=Zizania palustris TaxID=103762 RepID=A0A8J5T938_ZIZPA|nr:hypothetical protein GUJ93_ZPchr0015g6616 [Zizania palustris]
MASRRGGVPSAAARVIRDEKLPQNPASTATALACNCNKLDGKWHKSFSRQQHSVLVHRLAGLRISHRRLLLSSRKPRHTGLHAVRFSAEEQPAGYVRWGPWWQ